MSRLFGTDGIRGKANVAPMDSETMLRLGRAIARVCRRSTGTHRILIGKDTRLSGYLLETALESGIASMGVDTWLCGPLPTPGVAFMTRSMRADAGIMISASHNPYEDNGIKFFGPDGFKLADETEDEIERLMQPAHQDELRASPDLIGKAFRIDDAVGRYTVYLKSCIERDCKLDGLKIALDLANGAAYKIAPQVFAELGVTTVTTGDKPNGKNINDGVGSLYPEVVAKLVKETKSYCGIAFDGDADRVVLCDENGFVFDGDALLAICADDFRRRGLLKGDGVVGTVMSNLGLEVALRGLGLKLYRSDVGDRYVLSEMIARGVNLGGEQSGHIISLAHNTTGDGLLTALLVLSIAQRAQKPLSSYRNIVQRFPQVTISVPVKRKPPLEEIPTLSKLVKNAEEKLATTGRVLFRYSGTESKARVMVESEDPVLCNSLASEIAESIRRELAA